MDKTETKQMTSATPADPAEEPGTWTIMLYIAADGVLANFAVESLKQLIKSGAKQPKVVVGAQFSFPTLPVVVDSQAPKSRDTQPSPQSEIATGKATKHHFLFKRGSGGGPDANDQIRNVLELADKSLADKSQADKSQADKSLADTSQADTSQADTSQADTSQADKSQADESQADESQADKSQADKSEMANRSQEEALKLFLKSVYDDPECKADKYALIFWGHGPELLLQQGASNPTGSNRMYVTPEELRNVLELVKPPEDSSLDIIGFDACFMSMFEMAYELEGLAKYMVASQEEVPDASFPYEKLVELFQTYGNKTELLLREGIDAYLNTYRAYIFGESTGLKPVTLSAFRLDKGKGLEGLRKAVKILASELLEAPDDEGFRNLLIEVRQNSRDYAGGLFVDLYEFCWNLSKQLKKPDTTLAAACQGVLNELKLSADGTSNGLILKNGSDDKRNHGISIYLPYLTKEQFGKVTGPLVKGGTLTTKGGTLTTKGLDDVLNGAATEYLMRARRDLILDTESYYGGLKLNEEDTNWYSFITDLWTKVLITTAPADLDYHYSAQQSWMNLCRKLINVP